MTEIIGGRQLMVGPPGEQGPRGDSVTQWQQSTADTGRWVTGDGKVLEDPVLLPKGAKGEPGRGHVRRDTVAGAQTFVWEPLRPAEMLVYANTGVRELGDGRRVYRDLNTVEVMGDVTNLPVGFRPAMAVTAPTTGTRVFLTNDPWPATLPGTQVTAPLVLEGTMGYDAARANGFTGTVEQWNALVYTAGVPSGGTAGQVLYRTSSGTAWGDLPTAGSWEKAALTGSWKPYLGGEWYAKLVDGIVHFKGWVVYDAADASLGQWWNESVILGQVPGGMAPVANVEEYRTIYRGDMGARSDMCRVNVQPDGRVHLMAASIDGSPRTVPLGRGLSQLNLTGVSYPAAVGG